MSRPVIYSFIPNGSFIAQKSYGWAQSSRERTFEYLKRSDRFPILASVADSKHVIFSIEDAEIPEDGDLWKAVMFEHRATVGLNISLRIRRDAKEVLVEEEMEMEVASKKRD